MSRRPSLPIPKLFSSQFKPPRIKRSMSWPSLRVVTSGVVVLIVLIVLSGWWPILKVHHLEIEGDNSPVLVESLQSLIGQSIFSPRVNRLPDIIANHNLTLTHLTCRRGLPDTIRCHVEYRVPKLIWRTANQDYLVDKFGLLYALRPTNDQSLVLTIEDKLNNPVQVGEFVVNQEIVSQYLDLANRLKEIGLSVERLTIGETIYQVGAVLDSIRTASGGKMTALFLTTVSLDHQVATLEGLLSAKSGLITERIDLRVPGYVYFH